MFEGGRGAHLSVIPFLGEFLFGLVEEVFGLVVELLERGGEGRRGKERKGEERRGEKGKNKEEWRK